MGFFSRGKKYATISAKDTPSKNKRREFGIKNETSEPKTSGLWVKCPGCNEILYKSDIEKNLQKCNNCDHYFVMDSKQRMALLIDEGTFVEYDRDLTSVDPLNFPGYAERFEKTQEKTSMKNGVFSGIGNLNGIKVSIAVMEFNFLGGSMGSVVGEKITRAIEKGIEEKIPVIVVSTSGGARMHEGILSLMQMGKTSAALERLRGAGLPFISIPVDPTTGGVTASFAMLGDVIISEPGALIGFAGPRVIEQTIKQKLPEGFQKSEFLLECGMIDVIAKREELKDTIAKILGNLL